MTNNTSPTPRHSITLTNDERTVLTDALYLRREHATKLNTPANPDAWAWAQIADVCTGLLERLGETS